METTPNDLGRKILQLQAAERGCMLERTNQQWKQVYNLSQTNQNHLRERLSQEQAAMRERDDGTLEGEMAVNVGDTVNHVYQQTPRQTSSVVPWVVSAVLGTALATGGAAWLLSSNGSQSTFEDTDTDTINGLEIYRPE